MTLSAWRQFQAAAIATVGVPLVEALGATYSWREAGTEHLHEVVRHGHQPILALWHGRILTATLYFRDRGIVAMTSQNFDGEWVAQLMRRFGYHAARGSTSKGGAKALVQLRREMAAGFPTAFTVDGPRGPARAAQPGASWLASATDNPIVPFHIEADRFWTVNSWDRHQVPKPGGTLAVAIGSPIVVPADADEAAIEAGRLAVEGALVELETQAKLMLEYMLLISSPRFAEHTTPPGHPERPERAVVFDAAADAFARRGGRVVAPTAASRHDLARVHTPAYLDRIAATAGHATALDPDTYTSPESHEIALLAAGAAIAAARHARDTGEPAMALVRPPGHHAEPGRAMGFCLYNNIAVAAAALRADGVARVAIVDIDVHHGNGTQAAFYADPSVLFISSHQYPYYPGTGAVDETGSGAGLGFTLNLPLAAGATDADYERLYETRVVPALETFKPDVVLVSAGYDAHVRDPLAGMRVTTDGFTHLIAILDDAAKRLCARRLMLVTEGGYHAEALRECLDATIGVIT